MKKIIKNIALVTAGSVVCAVVGRKKKHDYINQTLIIDGKKVVDYASGKSRSNNSRDISYTSI